MARTLPAAEVVRKYIDESFDAQAQILVLRWDDVPGNTERLWELPEGLCVVGNAPTRLGYRIRRHGEDSFAVRLLWGNTQLSWPALSKMELLASCLSPVLGCLGIDLWSLLEQPMESRRGARLAA
jgi:hypothetical protein